MQRTQPEACRNPALLGFASTKGRTSWPGIDCNACVPVCPVEAIFPEDELPEAWAHYTEWNAYLVEYWATAEKSEEDILTWKDAS